MPRTADDHDAYERAPFLFCGASKRRRGYPSETHVKHETTFAPGGEIELLERLE